MGALSLAADLAQGHPLEHGLHSTLVAMRLCERLAVDTETAAQTYYACLLFYVGCTADAEVAAELFPADDALATYFTPALFGSPAEKTVGIMRALSPPGPSPVIRAGQIVRRLPRARREYKRHMVAICEVARMLCDRLGMPPTVQTLFAQLTERWDGKGTPGHSQGDQIALPVRVAHVARDAAFQCALGGEEFAARVVGDRAGGAFDPAITAVVTGRPDVLRAVPGTSAWDEVLGREPGPPLTLESEAIERALAAMGAFADLASPFLVGHSSGVAELATASARRCRLDDADIVTIRRAALVHDVGRVAVPTRVWQKPEPLTPDEWERMRLHPYHSERILARSPFLAALAPVATFHHERLDGSGYHRGSAASALSPAARLLAAADAYHAMTEPRPHRSALPADQAARTLTQDARTGRLDPDSVAAVLEAAGQRAPRLERPAGLTAREAEVVGLLARGLQTKQIAAALGISSKTADRHIQNAYAKIGVSTRAAAAVFAMQHGLTTWGELPIGTARPRS